MYHDMYHDMLESLFSTVHNGGVQWKIVTNAYSPIGLLLEGFVSRKLHVLKQAYVT